MSQVTIVQAAKLVGRDRKTLYRRIREGGLTATTSVTGTLQIDTSELIRVFGELRTDGDKPASGATGTVPQRETSEATLRLALLEAELRHSRELLAAKDAQIEDLRRAVLLLEGVKTPAPVKKSLFGKLWG